LPSFASSRSIYLLTTRRESEILAVMEPGHDQIPQHDEPWLPLPTDLGGGQEAASLCEGRAWLWSLVLEARTIPSRVEVEAGVWRVLVPPALLDAACRELRHFEEENRDWPPSAPGVPSSGGSTLSLLSVLLLLATFHNVTRFDLPLFGLYPPDWFRLGSADAGKILAGQWWRAITALTLHADWSHLLGNLAFGGVLIAALCAELGPGLAWSLLLVAGTAGNLANALLQPAQHSAIGASTLVFAAIGMLGAMGRGRSRPRRPWLLPAAAALALLALLGTEGKNTDLGAHLFGFLFGILFGVASRRSTRPGPGVNAFLSLASAAVVVAAWWRAVTAAG
jgi:membrane associated rhomboid family serine protease